MEGSEKAFLCTISVAAGVDRGTCIQKFRVIMLSDDDNVREES